MLAGLFRLGIATPGMKVIANPGFRESLDNSGNVNYDALATSKLNSHEVISSAYRLRIVNVLFGTLLFVALCILLTADPSTKWGIQLAAVWCFIPAFVFSSATLTNDVLAALFCVSGLIGYLRYRLTNSRKAMIASAIFFGLGLLTKSTVLFLWAALVSVEVFRRPIFRPSMDRLTFVLLPLIVGGAGVIRSLSLHPAMSPDPVRLNWMNSSPLLGILSWPLMLVRNLYATISTSVGVLGAQTLWLPGWIYGTYLGLFLLIVFFAIFTRKRSSDNSVHVNPASEIFLASSAAAAMLLIASVVKFRESGEAMHARLLLGYIPGILFGLAASSKILNLATEKWVAKFTRYSGLILLVVSLITLSLFDSVLIGLISYIRETFSFQKSLEYYADISMRILTSCMVVSAITFFAIPVYRWLLKVDSNLGRRTLVISGAGFVFNIALLFMYVLPGLSL